MTTTMAPETADQASEIYSSEMVDEHADRVSTMLPDTWTNDSASHTSNDNKEHEFNKKLLVSLSMLLPAIAAIIGVVAWAISAEVVMGAKREAVRRQSESTLRLHNNRFDYSRFTNVPLHPLPTKEMLVDHSSHQAVDGGMTSRPHDSLNILQHHLEELSRDYLARRMDNEPVESGNANAKQQPEVNNKFKNALTHEHLAQLLKKFLSSQKLSSNANPPQIVMVAPLASHKINVSKPHVETTVTTSRPKALELKISPAKEPEKNSKGKVRLDSVKRKVTQAPPTASKKRTSSNSSSKKTNHNNNHRTTTTTTTTKAPTTKLGKNYKAKIYEKEIDILLQKIEKLEKKQNIKPEKSSIPESIANNKLLNGQPADIAEKIKNFMSGEPSEASEPSTAEKQEDQGQQWGGDFPPYLPPPMPPPPLPFMPMMPPPPPPMALPGQEMSPALGQEASMPGQYTAMHADTYPRDPMQVEPSNEHYHSQVNNAPMTNGAYMQPPASPQPVQHYPDNLQMYGHQTQQQHQQHPPQQTYSHEGNQASQTYQQSHYEQLLPSVEGNVVKRKKNSNNRGGIFKRKFKLSSIFNSVMPKNKKKEEPKPSSDNRNIHIGPGGQVEPMMVQESQMHSHVDRGNGFYYEQPGVQMSMGSGPMGGGSQVKVSPMGILKTLVLPLLPKPRMNLNGKVVFGVVLENGVGFGKKPKTVFQHFSTGRI